MTGSAMGGAGAARDHRGSHRAAMMQPPSSQLMSGPQSAYAAVNQPLPPPPGSYLGMNVNLGLTMTMSDMESSIRAYHPSASQHPQQQQHHTVSPSTHTDAGGSFWRPQQMDAAGAYGGKAHGGLELELGDILGAGGSSNDSDRDGMRPEGASPDVTMSVMGSSFEVSPFGDHMSIGGSGVGMMKSGGGYAHSHALLRQQEQQQNARGGSIGEHQDLLGRPSTTRSISSSSSAGGVPTNPNPNSTTPTSATEGSNTSEYSRFVDSRDEPDLSQHKIDEKNEKCQFHNCPNRARVSQAYGKFCNRHVIVAPCGFPGCRDKALLNSSMCDKHLAQGKDALHKILASRAQNVPVCRTFGCFKNDQGRGYCRGHEKLLMATGRLPKHINKRRLNSAYTMCSYPGCNKHSQRNHLCRTHGNLITKQAEELCSRSAAQGGSETYEEILSRLQKDIRKCTHPSCTKNSQRDRLCTMHYYEKHNLQRDGGGGSSSNSSGGDQPHTSSNSSGPSEVTVPVCSIPDCNLQALGGAKGMCKYHSGGQGLKSPMSDGSGASSGMMIRDAERTRCNVPGCVQAAYTSGICVQHLKQQQTQQQQPHMLASGSRYNNNNSNNNVLSFGGDGRFSPASMGDPTNPRASMDSFYAGGGAQGASAANAYANALDVTMNSYAAMSTGGRHVPSGGAPGSSDVENEAKHALVSLNTGKPGENRSYVNSSDSRSTKCANPICTRESYGRELCESCQSMFSPLVVSVGGGDSLGSSGGAGTSYPFSVGGGASAQPEPETSPHGWGEGGVKDASSLGKASQGASTKATSCRVQQCNKAISQGGLCETHLRLFQNGTLSVDEITLPSRQSKAPSSETAAAAAAPKPSVASASMTTNLSGGKMKKYFCKTEGCDKQAQRRGLCKRHFRLQENNAASSAQPSASEPSSMDFAMTSNQQQSGSGAPCRFPGCIQIAATGALCSLHANASFCWQPGCENIVNGPQFCEFHAYRKQCAYEGCNYSIKDATSSGCATHAMERRCSHAHCDKFAVSDRCRLHQISCHEEPCALCELHGSSGMDDDDEAELQQQQVHPQRTGGGGQRMKENQFAQGNANNEFGAASNAKGNAMFRESRLI
ncbi:hypothetical protein FI667_g1213, partial [Globisporangium splendens]